MSTSPSSPRRIPWVPIVLSLLVGVASVFAIDPIRDAITGAPASDARLERSLGYVVLGPISSIFDAMTLFTVGQIIGFTLWAIGLYVASRVFKKRDRPARLLREATFAAASFIGLLAWYGAVVLMPRPMAQLIVTRPDAISVDFHSHTRYSHDGRAGWSAENLRDWHAAGGYDVAYITDHATFDGVAEGLPLDSALAGQATTTLLPGLETILRGEHVNLLNAGFRYKGLTSADFREVDLQALVFTSMIPNAEPVIVQTIPGNLSNLSPAGGPKTAGIRAIELVDGSPRGMSQSWRDRARIIHLADTMNLALVAGSDNHGWGRTAPAWTLLRMTDWRGYRPDSLANQIEQVIRVSGRRATKVLERTTASPSPLGLIFTMPAVVWNSMITLSSGERVAWLVWIWGAWSIVWLMRRRRTAPET